jgi:hypothetical protein
MNSVKDDYIHFLKNMLLQRGVSSRTIDRAEPLSHGFGLDNQHMMTQIKHTVRRTEPVICSPYGRQRKSSVKHKGSITMPRRIIPEEEKANIARLCPEGEMSVGHMTK